MKWVLTRRQLVGATPALALTSLIPAASWAESDDTRRANQPSEYERLRRKAAAGLELPLSTRKRVRRAVIGWTSASRFAAPSSYLQHRRSLSVSTMERKVLKGVSVSRPMTLSPIPHVRAAYWWRRYAIGGHLRGRIDFV